MLNLSRFAAALGLLSLILPFSALAKPKKKIYNNSPQQVFDAALRTARERHVVTFVDEKNLMFTFETGRSVLSEGFVANASVEPDVEAKATLIINVQHKVVGKNPSFSLNAGDRMADKFYAQVEEELARNPSQQAAIKPDSAAVPVPDGAKRPALETGKVTVSCTPEADVIVDGSFVGNTPATLSLVVGKHTIQLSHQGFTAYTREISVLAEADTKLNATLTKE